MATVEQDGRVVARWPYTMRLSRLKRRYMTMPPLTMFLGPWIENAEQREYARFSREEQLLLELLERMPDFDHMVHDCPPQFTNWLPLHWEGFTQTTRYTYVIDQVEDTDLIWNNFHSRTRRAIRKADKHLHVRDDLGYQTLQDLIGATFERQGLVLPYPPELLRRLYSACKEHDAGKAYFAEDKNGNIHSAIIVVWDSEKTYYLAGGTNPDHKDTQGPSLLLWQALQDAADHSAAFDFEGSMLRPIAHFFRAFGARQVPYYRLSKSSPRMRKTMLFMNALRTLRGKA